MPVGNKQLTISHDNINIHHTLNMLLNIKRRIVQPTASVEG